MRVMSLIRIWFALMVCIILCVGFFNSKIFHYIKSREKLLHTNFYIRNKATSLIPMPQRMKKVIKGMLITKASSSEALLQIAETIKDQYTNKKSMKLHFLSTMKITVITKKNYLTNLLVKAK